MGGEFLTVLICALMGIAAARPALLASDSASRTEERGLAGAFDLTGEPGQVRVVPREQDPVMSAATGCFLSDETKVLASNGAEDDTFGFGLAASGDAVIVGARTGSGNVPQSGSAYVYRWDGIGWPEEQMLVASDGDRGDFYGRSVAASGDVVVIGAPGHDANGRDAGAAYVYRWDGSTWVEEQKLMASDGVDADEFGFGVAVSGDVVAVGVHQERSSQKGSAYVFRWNGASWEEEQKLLASDGSWGDQFGIDVAASEDLVVVGAVPTDRSEAGAAYVYRWDGASWIEEEKLVPSDGEAGDTFGIGLAATEDVVVVGAQADDDQGINSGAAYVYRRDGASWVEEAKLLASDGAEHAAFGRTVDIHEEVVVIGSPWHDFFGGKRGAAYVYQWNGTSWEEAAKLLASDGAFEDGFGVRVATTGDVVVATAHFDDDKGERSGSAYIYHCPENTPPICNAGGGPWGYVVECSDGLGSVPLDGTGSSDADGDPLSFLWSVGSCSGGTLSNPLSATPTLELAGPPPCPTACSVALEVNDGLESAACSAAVTVQDTLAPEIQEVGYDGLCVWSQNHKYLELPDLTSLVIAEDVCDTDLQYEVTGCTSNQAEDARGSGNTTRDCEVTPDGHGVVLRAERIGGVRAGNEGRLYEITVRVTDRCSNSREATGTIFVPHDSREHPDCVRAGKLRNLP